MNIQWNEWNKMNGMNIQYFEMNVQWIQGKESILITSVKYKETKWPVRYQQINFIQSSFIHFEFWNSLNSLISRKIFK